MADFAKAQLLKYGWKEGKGLGKNENGLTKALKPTLKFDNAGIGYSETNSEHWWEALYDNTIKNVKVEMHEDKISLSKINNSNTIDSSTISCNKSKTEQQKYGNFLKSSTLLDGHLIQDISIEKEEKTAKDSVYIPLTDEQLYKACDGYKTTRYDLLNGKLERIAQQDRMFLNVSIGISQPDANLVKENTMIHRKTAIELDTEESEDPEESQEMIDENTSQHETKDFVIRSKSARKNHKKRLNKLTQQFSICSLKRNTDSSYNPQHDEELARIKKEKKSQLNVKSGKCSKKRKKNKRKKSLEQKTRISYNTLNETSIDIKDKLKNTAEGVYLSNQISSDVSELKNRVLTTYLCIGPRKPINLSSNNLNNKTDKNIHQIILSATKDRNMNIKQDIQQQKTKWEYFDVGKKNFDPLLKKKYLSNSDTVKMSFYKSLSISSTESRYEQYEAYINNSDDKFHNKDKTIKRKTDQQKQIKKQLEKIINPKNVYTDDLNNVIKKLTTFELTEEVSANALKKKLTQTHLTPV